MYVIAAILLAMSLALYQPMIQCAIALLLICLFFDIAKSSSNKKNILTGMLYIMIVLACFVFYSLIVVSEISKSEIPLVATYNGITEVGKFDSINSCIESMFSSYY